MTKKGNEIMTRVETVHRPRNLWSVGKLAEQYQVEPSVMAHALDLVGIVPAFALDAVVYYPIDDEGAELIREYLRMRRKNDFLNVAAEWTADIPVREGFVPVYRTPEQDSEINDLRARNDDSPWAPDAPSPTKGK
jgi:hypothetical protein